MDTTTYLSPFSWRYGSPEMRRLWSEEHKRLLWRQLWVTLAEVQHTFGLVRWEQVEDLRLHAGQLDLARVAEIEAEIQHDVMAEVRTFAEQCAIGGGIIHLGMTSMDIVDNCDVLRIRQALDLVILRLREVLGELASQIEKYSDLPLMAFTHLQPAEPTTLGYRLAQYGQDLLVDLEHLERFSQDLKGKGMKGAVGTSASYQALLGAENLSRFEALLSEKLDLHFFEVTTQTYPRKQDYDLCCALAGVGASLYKFAFDLRILQSPAFGEMAEPFGARQVGSSAMPFKRNPINAEKINSLGRWLAQFPRLAWDNAAHSLLERTLDDSANRRSALPEGFLITEEMLLITARILRGLRVDERAIHRNLETYGPFAATEQVLMALVKAGADRQGIHERLREHALVAWETVQRGEANPLAARMAADPELQLPSGELQRLLNEPHLGDAPDRARRLARQILHALDKHPSPTHRRGYTFSSPAVPKSSNLDRPPPFLDTHWPGRIKGKVRDIYLLPDRDYPIQEKLLLITTDRLSAFDRILGGVPYKGQVLNQLSAWWFEQLRDIVPSHMLALPDPNALVAIRTAPFPVEVVVRGYITGVTSTALWYQYSLGERLIYGHSFPDGLRKNQALPTPIITPTTKGGLGGHDERLTVAQVTGVDGGTRWMDPEIWEQVQAYALAMFQRGQEIAAQAGLILVDTKYEFGQAPDGRILVIDEVHTPDSSRFWLADSYPERFEAGEEPENFDKEFIRLAYAAQGYRGEGEPPVMPETLWEAASQRYIRIYEMLIQSQIPGLTFSPGEYPVVERLAKNLRGWMEGV